MATKNITLDELEIYIQSIIKKERVMESGQITINGKEWSYKIKRLK